MTTDEQNQWYDDLRIRIPSLWQWAEQLPDTRATLLAWHKDVFADLDLRDCLAVTWMLVAGDLDKPYGSDIPAFWRKEARKVRYGRKERESKREKQKYATDGAWHIIKSGSMGAAYKKLCEIRQQLKADGLDSDEINFKVTSEPLVTEWASLL